MEIQFEQETKQETLSNNVDTFFKACKKHRPNSTQIIMPANHNDYGFLLRSDGIYQITSFAVTYYIGERMKTLYDDFEGIAFASEQEMLHQIEEGERMQITICGHPKHQGVHVDGCDGILSYGNNGYLFAAIKYLKDIRMKLFEHMIIAYSPQSRGILSKVVYSYADSGQYDLVCGIIRTKSQLCEDGGSLYA